MTAGAGTLNPRLQEIAEEFGAVGGRDRLQLLLEFSEDLPPRVERPGAGRHGSAPRRTGTRTAFPHSVHDPS